MFLYWKKHLTKKPEISSCILPQYLWYNETIQVDKNSIYLLRFSEKRYLLCLSSFSNRNGMDLR